MTIDQFTLLYYLCELAGLAMIVGGIWLIYKEKIYIDAATNQPIEVDVPIFGKFKTNIPALALFALGFIPLIYPIWTSKNNITYYKVKGHIKADSTLEPVVIYSVVHMQVLRQTDQDFTALVPILKTEDYQPQVLYVAGPVTLADQLDLGMAKNGLVQVPRRELQDPSKGVGVGASH